MIEMSKASPEMDRKAAMAALMLSKGWSRQKICIELAAASYQDIPYKEPYLTKLISLAKKKGWLEQKYIFHGKALPPHLREIECGGRNYRSLIVEKYDSLSDVEVVDFKVSIHGSSNMDAVLSALHSMLKRTRYLGVSRGASLYHLAIAMNEIDNRAHLIPTEQKVRTFPTTAEFYKLGKSPFSSSNIARMMANSLGKSDQDVPNLENLMSFIPVPIKNLHDIREAIDSYVEVFGKRGANETSEQNKLGFIDKMDMYLCSVSEEDKPIGGTERLKELIKKTESTTHLSNLDADKYIGDIGGSIILRDIQKDLASQRDALIEYNERLNSINYNDIASLSEKAIIDRKINGVVVVAFGKKKAAVIKTLLKAKMINKLVCDSSIAELLVQ